jgi:epoxide hydrolase-like predicted phosphatase
MVKAVLFDFGGVLVRTRNQKLRIQWETNLGLNDGQLSVLIFESETAHLATLGILPESAIWKYVAAALKLDDEQLGQLKLDFWKEDQLDLQLVQYLRSLRPNYKTGILSNAWSNGRQLFTETYHLGDVVDELVISAEIGMAKPDAKIYLYAAEKLGVRPKEVIFVDDMPRNVDGAVNAGMVGIQYIGTSKLLDTLSQIILDRGNGGSSDQGYWHAD